MLIEILFRLERETFGECRAVLDRMLELVPECPRPLAENILRAKIANAMHAAANHVDGLDGGVVTCRLGADEIRFQCPKAPKTSANPFS